MLFIIYFHNMLKMNICILKDKNQISNKILNTFMHINSLENLNDWVYLGYGAVFVAYTKLERFHSNAI